MHKKQITLGQSVTIKASREVLPKWHGKIGIIVNYLPKDNYISVEVNGEIIGLFLNEVIL